MNIYRIALAAVLLISMMVSASAEMLPVNDLDGDGVPNDMDNCLLTPNPFQEDADNDEVGDACDVCPGVDDRVDEDEDGRPDCLHPPSFDEVKEEWKCGKDKKKVYVTFYPNPNSDEAITQCISLSALKVLQYTKRNRRIYLGLPAPPKDCNCNGIDEDGDGIPDDDFVPIPTRCGQGACQSTGFRICVNGQIVDNCEPGIPAPIDNTCNSIDDDCDGEVDEDFFRFHHLAALGLVNRQDIEFV